MRQPEDRIPTVGDLHKAIARKQKRNSVSNLDARHVAGETVAHEQQPHHVLALGFALHNGPVGLCHVKPHSSPAVRLATNWISWAETLVSFFSAASSGSASSRAR